LFCVAGSPIIRPLWWTDPEDVTSQSIDDQYFLGETMMVAPIVDPNITKRDIYIPNGTWLDTFSNKSYSGKFWLKDFNVELGQVAAFIKMK